MRGSRGVEDDSKIEHGFLNEVKKDMRGSRGTEGDSKIEHGFLNEVKKDMRGVGFEPMNYL